MKASQSIRRFLSTSMASSRRFIVPEGQTRLGPYSPAVVVGKHIFVSGQLGLNAHGTLAEGIKEQTKQALQNLANVLTASDSNLNDVVKTTVFLKHMTDFPEMNQIYAEFFTQNLPARSAIEISELPKPGALVEIEAVAIKE
ncbi:unnamed protein product [Cyprideis torosa]|uniref:Uncharacterized protein n=1 Tax=Cyprideis torosa TaxID=163714 RepID=A0A7R8WKY9_9CRUS|nr:unnamed protein product [Cyprideis torosa]CAG0897479.1 unnamed protein product [Cyprideis torosa]